MKDGFTQIPNLLVEDSTLTPDQLTVWIAIRRSNGAPGKRGVLKGCYRSLETLSERVSGPPMPTHAPGSLKRTVKALRTRGLLAVRQRQAGQTALRWAIWPGPEGDAELAALLEAHEIDDAQHQRVQEYRRTYRGPSGSADRPPGDRHADPQGSASKKQSTDSKKCRQNQNKRTSDGPSADYDPQAHAKMREEIAEKLQEESGVENTSPEGES